MSENDNDYPVSDLGSPVAISATEDSASDVEMLENTPKDNEAQWQNGELTITAEDGSIVSLRPSSEDKMLVEIELNDSGDIQMRNWSEGFSVDCPSLVDGCGDNALKF
ncbi:hypothetical protein [Granulosicoccus antarcticus]|uniref:hypothetical protein n=1 Tax=Granulosicoccus antarcticus TaxID=437505 RepID=UPI0012FD5442|nr:hypothetical protein [Granulosicoccus antarcticus]